MKKIRQGVALHNTKGICPFVDALTCWRGSLGSFFRFLVHVPVVSLCNKDEMHNCSNEGAVLLCSGLLICV